MMYRVTQATAEWEHAKDTAKYEPSYGDEEAKLDRHAPADYKEQPREQAADRCREHASAEEKEHPALAKRAQDNDQQHQQ